MLMDGGTTWNNNMIVAVNECLREPGIEGHDQISVDIITLDTYSLSKFDEQKPDQPYMQQNNLGFDIMPWTMEYYFRNNEIHKHYRHKRDIFEFMMANPDVNYRYLFVPQSTLLP